MALSRKNLLGVAREATAGTMQAGPTLYLPAKTKFQNKKGRIYFQEDRYTRDGNNNVADGTRHSEGEISGAWYNDTSVYLLLAFMGADTASQPNSGTDPTVWQHALALTDNPLPLDFWLGLDAASLGFGYTMPYNVVKSAKFKWQAGQAAKGFEVTFATLGQPFTKSLIGWTSAPNAPVPTTSGTGGTIAAGVYQVLVSLVYSDGHESAPSAAGPVTTSGSTSTITVPSPATATGVTGWYAYVSQVGGAANTSTRQQAAGSPTAIGTPLTISAPPTSTGAVVGPNLSAPTFSTLAPFPGYAPQIQFSAVQSNDIEEMEIDLEQKYTLFSPSNGSPAWVTAYPGERTAKISFKARFDTDTLYQKYAVNTGIDDSILVTVNGPTISHAYTQQLQLNFPIVGYDDMEHDHSKDNVMISAKATPRPGSAVNSLFSALVQNTVSSYII